MDVWGDGGSCEDGGDTGGIGRGRSKGSFIIWLVGGDKVEGAGGRGGGELGLELGLVEVWFEREGGATRETGREVKEGKG